MRGSNNREPNRKLLARTERHPRSRRACSPIDHTPNVPAVQAAFPKALRPPLFATTPPQLSKILGMSLSIEDINKQAANQIRAIQNAAEIAADRRIYTMLPSHTRKHLRHKYHTEELAKRQPKLTASATKQPEPLRSSNISNTAEVEPQKTEALAGAEI